MVENILLAGFTKKGITKYEIKVNENYICSMKIKFLLGMLFFVGQLQAQEKPVFLISLEKEVNEFETIELIRFTCEFKNTTSDTLYFLDLAFDYASWEISKRGEKIYPCRDMCNSIKKYSKTPFFPNESRVFSISPNDDYCLDEGQYVINGVLLDTFGNVYRSNKLAFEVKEANKEMVQDLENVSDAKSNEEKVENGLYFLKKYNSPYLRDAAILEVSKALHELGKFQDAINLLLELDEPTFPTTKFERNSAYLSLSLNFFALDDFEKSGFYHKKFRLKPKLLDYKP